MLKPQYFIDVLEDIELEWLKNPGDLITNSRAYGSTRGLCRSLLLQYVEVIKLLEAEDLDGVRVVRKVKLGQREVKFFGDDEE